MLTGARVRPAERVGLELIVPNLSGGRGDYVMPWSGLRTICRPTVHDTQLAERISTVRSVTPATIRDVAREVAVKGLAGRAAVVAAAAALAAEEESHIFTKFDLLLRIVQQAEPPDSGRVPPEQEHPAQLEVRAKRVIAAIAPLIRQDKEMIAQSISELATLFGPSGVGPRASRARLPQNIAMLKLLRHEIMELPLDMDDQVAGLVRMVTSTADMTLSCVESTLGQSRALLDHLLDLLISWQNNASGVSRHLARSELLMDGWDRICRLWALSAKVADRRNALDEIVAMLPVIPREAGEWVGFPVEVHPPRRPHRLVVGREDWRTGQHVQDLIARNELLIEAA